MPIGVDAVTRDINGSTFEIKRVQYISSCKSPTQTFLHEYG